VPGVAQVAKADLLRHYQELPSTAAKEWPGLNARQIRDAEVAERLLTRH
jgi:hypothetical protein